MNERLREALRRKLAAHNRLVCLSTLCATLGVATMWAGLYFAMRWMAVLGASVVKGVDATMPARVDQAFAATALALLTAGWFARRAGFFQRVREERGAGLMLLELALLPARATWGTLDNARSFLRLDDDDLRTASDLLVRIVRAGKLAATALPQEFSRDGQRERVVHALALMELIYLRESDAGAVYSVADPQRLLRFL